MECVKFFFRVFLFLPVFDVLDDMLFDVLFNVLYDVLDFLRNPSPKRFAIYDVLVFIILTNFLMKLQDIVNVYNLIFFFWVISYSVSEYRFYKLYKKNKPKNMKLQFDYDISIYY